VEKPELYGKYLLIDLISVGGMAEVFKAKVLGVSGFHKIVAIKRILPSFSEQKEFVNMFVDEANIAGELHHHNIAQIYDLGEIDGTYYISMELVDGKDLRAIFDRLKNIQKPMPINMAAYICEKILAGLDYAHNKTGSAHKELNIVHRDVSPPNILISYNGEVKLVDFGIAKAAGKISKTQAGVLKGKFGYMSPEQVRGLTVDPRSDLFSVGVVLWEMLAGKRLFVGDNDYDTLEKVRHADIENPRTYNEQAPEALADIALKALQRDLKKRYLSAEDMRRDLQQYLYKLTPSFTYHDASSWMQEIFASELEESRRRMEEIQNLDPAALGFDISAITQSQEKSEKPITEPKMVAVEAASVAPNAPVATEPPVEEIEKPASHKHSSPRFAIIVAIMVCVLLIVTLAGFHILLNLGANAVDLNPDLKDGAIIDVKANHEKVDVFLDSKKVCLAPCTLLNVTAGKHEIRFEMDGFIGERRSLDVNSKDALKISGEVFKPGILKSVIMLRSDPSGADVLLNGEKQDFVTPGVLKSVPVGIEQKIVLRLNGYEEKEIKLNLERDEIKKLDEVLVPAAPAIKVVSDPAGASILLDGQDSGLKSPAYLVGLEEGKRYVVAAALDGHELYSETIEKMSAQVLTLSFPLKPKAAKRGATATAKTGTLEVKTTPSVRIYIDGKYSGRNSPAQMKLDVGKHEIKLVNPDANIHNITPVTIESGKTVSIEKIF